MQYYCRNSDPKFQEECKEIYLQRRKHYRLTGRYDTYHEKNEAMKEKLAERKKMKEEQRQQKLQEAQLHADTSLLGRFRNLFKSWINWTVCSGGFFFSLINSLFVGCKNFKRVSSRYCGNSKWDFHPLAFKCDKWFWRDINLDFGSSLNFTEQQEFLIMTDPSLIWNLGCKSFPKEDCF